jgi:hypothetical protein
MVLNEYIVEDYGAKLARLRDDLRSWLRLSASLANDLGLTPMARSRLGLNTVRARGEALRQHLLERYGVDGEAA